MNINSNAVDDVGPPLLIVCLGLFGMEQRCVDRSVHGMASGCCGSDWKVDGSLCFWITLVVL